MRIFILAALPSQSFARLVDTLARIEAPKWPVWMPSRASSQGQLLQIVNKEVNVIVSAASHPSLVVASSALLEKISVAREVTTEQINTVQDGFSFLGLVKQADPE